MKVAFLSSFPFFDILAYKKNVIHNILMRNPNASELALVYSHKGIKDHYKMWKNNLGFVRAIGNYRHQRSWPSDASEKKGGLEYNRSRLDLFVKKRGVIVKRFHRFGERACLAFLNQFGAEVIFNFSGEYIPKSVLDMPFWGVIGAHYGILPQVRGRDTIRWSILLNYPLYVCHIKLSPEFDMGDVVFRTPIPVYKGDSYQKIRMRFQSASAQGFINLFDLILTGKIKIEPQKKEEGSTFYEMGDYLRKKVDVILSRGSYGFIQIE